MPLLDTQMPQGLESMLGWGGITSSQRYNQAMQNNQINQQGALQDMFQKEQSLPVELDYKRALTGQAGEQTRGLKDKNDMNDFTKDSRYKTEISKLAKELSDSELESARAQVQSMSLHADPKIREMGDMLQGHFKELVQEKARQKGMMEREIELARIRAEEARATQAAKPAAGAAKPMTMAQYEAMLRQGASGGDATAAQALAQLEEDKRRKAAAGALITDQRVRGLLGLDEGSPDNSSTGKVEPKAAATPKLQGAQAEDWIVRAMKANKMTREQVIAEGKKLGKL